MTTNEYKHKVPARKKKWNPAIKKEVYMRRIQDDIIKGIPSRDLIDTYMNEFGGSREHIKSLIVEAVNSIILPEQKEHYREINCARLEQIYSESIYDGDRKSAIKAIDIMNKTLNLYGEGSTNVQINGEDTTFTISFGNGVNVNSKKEDDKDESEEEY